MISSTVSLIQSPYSRREAGGTTAQYSGEGRAASPVDMTELSAPRESNGAAWLSWKKAGAALLLAAPIVAGAVTDAHAAMVLPPTDPTVSCTPVEDVPNLFSCKYRGPLSESDVSIMKRLAAPTATDNKTALKVRESYGKLADTVQKHADEFKAMLVDTAGDLVMRPEQNVAIQTDDGNVKRTWYFKEVDGVGDFDVVVRKGKWSDQLLEVHGASITNTTRERLSGFAGNINVLTLDRFEVPDLSVQTYPHVEIRETLYSFSESAPTKEVHLSPIREIEVRQDGSTRVKEGDQPWVEEPAAAPTVK